MTVAKLHKLLGKLIEQGHARTRVLVNKPTFTSNLEADGVVMLDVCGAIPHTGPYADGDGFTAIRKDGRECTMTSVLLYGSSGEPSTGMTWEHTHRNTASDGE